NAAGIILCPSNPLISIGPILAVGAVRQALRHRRDNVVAVCPIVGGKSLKGPSDKMLVELGFDASCYGVAQLYRDVCATFVIDEMDAAERSRIESLDMRVIVGSTVMRTLEDKQRVAGEVLRLFGARAAGGQ